STSAPSRGHRSKSDALQVLHEAIACMHRDVQEMFGFRGSSMQGTAVFRQSKRSNTGSGMRSMVGTSSSSRRSNSMWSSESESTSDLGGSATRPRDRP